MLPAIAFWLFAAVLVFAAVMVVAARNPVHSVLFLILAFFNAAALFLLLGAEFLAMILLIVYVGAVAVLFLFVVMMLDINFAALREGALRYLPFGALVGLILLAELIFVVAAWRVTPAIDAAARTAVDAPGAMTNTEALGSLLYTDYIYVFQASGLILLVAMIGAIVLTLRHRPGVKRQKISDQVRRSARDAIKVKKVKVGEGIS